MFITCILNCEFTVKKPKPEKKKGAVKRRKNAKINEYDEAVEESDEGDFDDKELDYITDSGRYRQGWVHSLI